MTRIENLQIQLADASHAYYDMKERAEAAEAALLARDTPCAWTKEEDGAYWNTGCEQANCFFDAGPVENKYRFCPYCGHPVEVAS